MSKNIWDAVQNVSKELKVITNDATNPMYRSKYATLHAINRELLPLLEENNLLLKSGFVYDTTANQWCVVTTLIWIGGEGAPETVSVHFPVDRIADPQQQGKALTYARRYNIAGLFNLSFINDTDDDDGNSLVPGAAKSTKKVAPKPLDIDL